MGFLRPKHLPGYFSRHQLEQNYRRDLADPEIDSTSHTRMFSTYYLPTSSGLRNMFWLPIEESNPLGEVNAKISKLPWILTLFLRWRSWHPEQILAETISDLDRT